MNKPPIVEITWIDSCAHGGWMEMEDALKKKTMQCTSVGYIIEKNEEYITIAQNVSNDGDVGEVMCIPVVAVDRLEEL